MNYIEIMNHFWRVEETAQFTGWETKLFFYLVKTANSLGWITEFWHSDARVSANVGMSTNTLKTSRNRLKQFGLIAFREGGHGRGDKTKYQILPPKPLPKTLPAQRTAKAAASAVTDPKSCEPKLPDTSPEAERLAAETPLTTPKRYQNLPPEQATDTERCQNLLPEQATDTERYQNLLPEQATEAKRCQNLLPEQATDTERYQNLLPEQATEAKRCQNLLPEQATDTERYQNLLPEQATEAKRCQNLLPEQATDTERYQNLLPEQATDTERCQPLIPNVAPNLISNLTPNLDPLYKRKEKKINNISTTTNSEKIYVFEKEETQIQEIETTQNDNVSIFSEFTEKNSVFTCQADSQILEKRGVSYFSEKNENTIPLQLAEAESHVISDKINYSEKIINSENSVCSEKNTKSVRSGVRLKPDIAAKLAKKGLNMSKEAFRTDLLMSEACKMAAKSHYISLQDYPQLVDNFVETKFGLGKQDEWNNLNDARAHFIYWTPYYKNYIMNHDRRRYTPTTTTGRHIVEQRKFDNSVVKSDAYGVLRRVSGKGVQTFAG
ncbi:hypothetical protein [Emticicia sp. 17c]|uniref:hypothetical protein n=1 Tax=Emticicia sp. 17c TaxID=3127704 RepID=UPI00301E0EB2